MKVTLIGSLPPQKGISPYTTHLIRSLVACPGVELEVIGFRSLYPRMLYPGGEIDDPTTRGDLPEGVPTRRLLAWYDPLSWVRVGLTAQGDIIHAQWWSYVLAPAYAVLLRAAQLRGKPILLTLHNVLPHEQGRWKNLLNALVWSYADHIIVHSERMKEGMVDSGRFASSQISVIPHGILKPAALSGLDRPTAKKELGFPENSQVVLYFGHIRAYKGLDTLLEAFRLASAKVPRSLLVIAGQPWVDWQPYDQQIDALGLRGNVAVRLRFIPSIEVERYFAAADLVVLPYTHFDAQSGVGAMALSFGRAMVVSGVGGLPDITRDSRVVVPPNDAPALADAISAVLGDQRMQTKLEEDSVALAKAFDWEHIAARTVEVYKGMLRNSWEPARKG